MKSKKANKFVLIGIPNSGKSTIGKRVAKMLQMPFYDTDKLAIERLNLDNPIKLFSLGSQCRLMEEHYKLITELTQLDGHAIIEVWPESVLQPLDVKVLKKLGTIIYIKREPTEVKKKGQMVMVNTTTGQKINMQAEAIRLYAEERHHFEKLADLTLDNSGSENDAVEKLAIMIREAM